MAVEFEDTNYTPSGRPKKVGGITKLIMRLGLAKTPKKANTVMIAIIIIGFLWTGYYFFGLNLQETNNVENLPYLEDLTAQERRELPKDVLDALPTRN